MKVLDIIVNDRLSAIDHVSSLLSSCSKTSLLYALRVLHSRRIPAALNDRRGGSDEWMNESAMILSAFENRLWAGLV